MTATRLTVFASVTPGLESVLLEELTELGLAPARGAVREGGVELEVDRCGLWRIALRARTTESLRVRIGRFHAAHFDALARGLLRLPWAAYFPRDTAPRVEVSARRSRLFHTDAVAERAAATIAERLATPGGTPRADSGATVYVRLVRDEVTLSVDASGERLHRRGYRTHVGRAPLRETLAAALVRLAGVRTGTEQGVWDPFCGSATVLIEAASIRLGRPSQPSARAFAFETWPTHDADAFATERAALGHGAPADAVIALGGELDPEALAAARHNVAAAGLEGAVALAAGDSLEREAVARIPPGSAVVTNLPWGVRTEGGKALERTFARLGARLRERPDLGPVVVLNGTRSFARQTGLDWERLAALRNGGLPVEVLRLRRG